MYQKGDPHGKMWSWHQTLYAGGVSATAQQIHGGVVVAAGGGPLFRSCEYEEGTSAVGREAEVASQTVVEQRLREVPEQDPHWDSGSAPTPAAPLAGASP